MQLKLSHHSLCVSQTKVKKECHSFKSLHIPLEWKMEMVSGRLTEMVSGRLTQMVSGRLTDG